MLSSMMLNRTLGYSQAVRVGNLLFVSGQVAVNERGETVGIGDPRAQTQQIFANLKQVLKAGGSDLGSVAKLTTFATSLGFLLPIREVRHQVFGPIGHFPASTFVVISSLAKSEYLVEIEAVALIDERVREVPAPAARKASRTARRARPLTAARSTRRSASAGRPRRARRR